VYSLYGYKTAEEQLLNAHDMEIV